MRSTEPRSEGNKVGEKGQNPLLEQAGLDLELQNSSVELDTRAYSLIRFIKSCER